MGTSSQPSPWPRTWPEYSTLAEDLASGKGRLVTSDMEAIDLTRATEGVYFLSDSENIKDIVFKDYMTPKDSSQPLCSLTYTDKFRSSFL